MGGAGLPAQKRGWPTKRARVGRHAGLARLAFNILWDEGCACRARSFLEQDSKPFLFTFSCPPGPRGQEQQNLRKNARRMIREHILHIPTTDARHGGRCAKLRKVAERLYGGLAEPEYSERRARMGGGSTLLACQGVFLSMFLVVVPLRQACWGVWAGGKAPHSENNGKKKWNQKLAHKWDNRATRAAAQK